MASYPTRKSDAISQLLERLRLRIRAYVWTQGLALALAVACGWFWGSLAFDWLFEPPAPLRVALLALLAAALAFTIYRYLLRRAFVPLGDASLALLFERRFGSLQQGLLTAVELAATPAHAAPFNPQMLAHTRQRAEIAARDLPVDGVFDRRPLARAVALAGLLAVSTAVFALAASDAFGVWSRRSFLLSSELWPRKTHLSVVGFENGHKKVAKGSDFDLIVRAETGPERVVPETVAVRYGAADGVWARDRMTRIGVAAPGPDSFQQYAYQFKSLLAQREFWVQGGDDRAGPFFIDVVDSPTLTRATFRCEYPAYMRRAPRDVPAAGLVQLPVGTQVTLLAEANKPLASAQIDVLSGAKSPVGHTLNLAADFGEPQRSFSLPLGAIAVDETLLCSLVDDDGIRSRDPVRISLGAAPDEPPQVNIQLEGIGTAITPSAMLPTVGDIVDDYGVARAWFEFHVDEAPPSQQPLAAVKPGSAKVEVREAMEVGSLGLQPKQKFHFAVGAADSYALATAPNTASSQRYTLDVVTPEQLRGMLEARELMLRRRFETMIGEFTETRDLLARLELETQKPKPDATKPGAVKPGATKSGGASDAEKAKGKNKKAATEKAASEKPAAAKAAAAAKPAGDEPEDSIRRPETKTAEQLLTLARLHAERVVQNGQRSAHETIEVADAFDGICAELMNNRVDTEELKSRLKGGISVPLREIATGRFPELEKSLRQLQSRLAEPTAAAPIQAEAVRRADQIIIEMKRVLDRMLELETFNEALDLLRAVIADQEKISEETKAQQKKKLRELIEE